MTFVKYSVAQIAPLGSNEEMPEWVEGAFLGKSVGESGTPVLEGEENDADAAMPVTTVEG